VTGAPSAQSSLILPKGVGVPNDLALVEGSGSFHLPSRNAPSRIVAIYRGADLGVPAAGMWIGAIAFRRDGRRATAFKAHRQRMTVHMSTDGVQLPSETGAESFAAAQGRDRARVVDRVVVEWPAEARPTNPPAPFKVRIKLSNPFLLLPRRNLCVDIAVETESGKPESHYWYVDSETFNRSGTVGSARSYGTGCPASFKARARIPSLDGESHMQTSATTQSPSGGTMALLIVADRKDRWAGGRLPFALPGATGCKLYVNPIARQVGRTMLNDPTGLVCFEGPTLPKNATWAGLHFYEQVAVFDASANALGLRTSNYIAAKLGQTAMPLPARLLYHSRSVTTDVPTAAVDAGIVLEITP
jgi:hypothetical protein